MAEAGYKVFLELGATNRDNGSFVSFNDSHIELDRCSYSFIREVDNRGKVQTDLRGGNISFILSKLPSLTFLDWAVNPNKCYSGYIHIKDLSGNPKQRVFFENAACVNLKITYLHDGTSYIMVQGVLQAETIQLSGAKYLYNHWNSERYIDSSRVEVTEKAIDIFNTHFALNSEASINVNMMLGSETYPLQSFEMEFGQMIDHKGEPQSSVVGGVATVGLFDLPDEAMHRWLRNGTESDGRFLFGDEMMGYPLKMEFKGATCIGCFTEVGSNLEEGLAARLNILSQKIDFSEKVSFKVPY